MEGLRKGDTIKCRDAEDCITTHDVLFQEGVETDFLYEKDGEEGLWLKVVEVVEDGKK